MLDKHITYIVCWYTTLFQVSSVATRSDTGSYNMLDLVQSLVPAHYVCNGYVLTSSKGYNCILSCHVKIKRKIYTSSILQNFNTYIMHFVNFNIDMNDEIFNYIYCFGLVNILHKVLIVFVYYPYPH